MRLVALGARTVAAMVGRYHLRDHRRLSLELGMTLQAQQPWIQRPRFNGIVACRVACERSVACFASDLLVTDALPGLFIV